MCTVDNIRLLINPFNFVKLMFALYVAIIGINFASTDYISKAYGSYFISAGVGSFFLGFFSGIDVVPLSFAVRRHNKFLLLTIFFVETLLMAVAINTGLTCLASTVSEYSLALEADCLLNKPKFYSSEACLSYFRADKTAGLRLVWSSFFTLAPSDPKYYQYLSALQDNNLCCGFGPPLNCINDTRPFPVDRPLGFVDAKYLKRRLTCGDHVKYYMREAACLQYFDPDSIPQIIGGCEYDMGVGDCVNYDAKDFNAYGCADKLDQWIIDQVAPSALFLLGSSAINMLTMLISCCMLWKRKDSDVFPDFISENKFTDDKDKPARIIVYDRIKDNVVVKPQPDILYKRGFLLPPGSELTERADGDEEQGDIDEENNAGEAAEPVDGPPAGAAELQGVDRPASGKPKTPTSAPVELPDGNSISEKPKTPSSSSKPRTPA